MIHERLSMILKGGVEVGRCNTYKLKLVGDPESSWAALGEGMRLPKINSGTI